MDGFLVGGGVAFTFLAAQGLPVGRSVVDPDLVPTLGELLGRAKALGKEILLPEDVVVARELAPGAEARVVPVREIPDGWMGLDIGPRTRERFAQAIAGAGTVVWAGPMGAFEHAPFAAGTEAVARALVASQAFTVVGGGETGRRWRSSGSRRGSGTSRPAEGRPWTFSGEAHARPGALARLTGAGGAYHLWRLRA